MKKLKKYIKFLIIFIISSIGKFLFTFNRDNEDNKDFRNLHKILIIRLDEIGDVVMTTPLLRELRKNYPKAHITLIVKPQVYNLVELCPYIDNILTYNKENGKFIFFFNIIKSLFFCRKYLIKERYDLAIVPRWDYDADFSSFIAYFSCAKFKLGYSEHVNKLKEVKNKGYDQLYSQVMHTKDMKHEVERNLAFIKYLKGTIASSKLEVWVDHNSNGYALAFLDKYKIDHSYIKLIALVPSARDPRRVWSYENYEKLIGKLINQYGDLKIVILGGSDAIDFKILIKEKYDNGIVIDMVNQTTLREAAALIKLCDFYIGNNTGLLHFAASWNVPCVELSCHPKDCDSNHSLSPERFKAWGTKTIVLRPEHTYQDCVGYCNKEYAHCINQITVEAVFQAVSDILNKKFPNAVKQISDKAVRKSI